MRYAFLISLILLLPAVLPAAGTAARPDASLGRFPSPAVPASVRGEDETVHGYADVNVRLVRGLLRRGRTATLLVRIHNGTRQRLRGLDIVTHFRRRFGPLTEPRPEEWRHHRIRLRPPLPAGRSRLLRLVDHGGARFLRLDIAGLDLAPLPFSVWAGDRKLPGIVEQGVLFLDVHAAVAALGGRIGAAPDGRCGDCCTVLFDGQPPVACGPHGFAPGLLRSVRLKGRMRAPVRAFCARLGLRMVSDGRGDCYQLVFGP